MATSLLPSGGIALFGAPDSDIGSRVAKTTPFQAMQLDMTQDIVDELLESVRSGKPPQILFGRTPVRHTPATPAPHLSDCPWTWRNASRQGPWLTSTQQLKYADKTLTLQSASETTRTELYHSSGTGSDDDLEFASLIKHTLVAHKAENVTAGVDSALEQLKNRMAAVKEMKEANKYASLVSRSDAWPWRTAASPLCFSEHETDKCCLSGPSSATCAMQDTAALLPKASCRATSLLPPPGRRCSASLRRP